MANSRKSHNLNNSGDIQHQFERALGNILARVSTFISSKALSIGIAYSGGLDSSVLLHLVCQYAAKHAVPVHAFHVHHGLSDNADKWMEHCANTADEYKIYFDAVKVHVADIERHGLEQAARAARYEALNMLCRSHSVPLLLTAHHQDDQAETVILQLMRGAGLPGLSGMALCQEDHALLDKNIFLGRPLLERSRAELEKWAADFSLQFVVDESNSDSSYKRNALRHEIFPVMERHFPSFASLVARSASHAQAAQVLLQDLAHSDLEACKADGQGKALDLGKLSKLSNERIHNLLRYWLHASNIQFPSLARIEEIREQVFHAARDRYPAFDFGEFLLGKIGSRLELIPNLGQPPAEGIELQWQGEQEIIVPQWRGRLILRRARQKGIDPEKLRLHPLVLRGRIGHEKLKIAHNRPSRSLKNLFQESSIPPWKRKWFPVVYLEKELLLVAGLGMDIRHSAVPDGIEVLWETDWQ